jgi:hypothetical protein
MIGAATPFRKRIADSTAQHVRRKVRLALGHGPLYSRDQQQQLIQAGSIAFPIPDACRP